MNKAVLAMLALISVLALHLPAAAQGLVATFDTAIGPGPTPGATATLKLNADGTISAKATSLSTLQLVGFGIDSFFQYPSYDFSSPNAITTGWGTSFGGFASGWTSSSGVTGMTWLIGAPGTFTSFAEALNGEGSAFDAFIFAWDPSTGDFTEYAANFAVAVPEPETYVLFIAGLGAMALARRRSRQAQEQGSPR